MRPLSGGTLHLVRSRPLPLILAELWVTSTLARFPPGSGTSARSVVERNVTSRSLSLAATFSTARRTGSLVPLMVAPRGSMDEGQKRASPGLTATPLSLGLRVTHRSRV